MTCFLITTSHLETHVWFRDEEDFKAGMNYVASVSFSLGICVLAFILMSNHVHFVLACSEDEAVRFITEFKRVYSRYLNVKYGTQELLRRNDVDIRFLSPEAESIERAIAYVQMNSVAANICTHPSEYPWGTGRTFFQVEAPKGRPLGSMTARSRIKCLHSKVRLPSDWILADGYICPRSYVGVKFVEGLFRTPKRMSFFLQNSSKARQVLARTDTNLPSFQDKVILAGIPDLCRSLFGKWTIIDLCEEERKVVVDQIKRRFSADVAQIARVTGLSYQEVVRLLESF